MRYQALYKSPEVPQYSHLREASGLSPKTEEAAAIGLRNSLCCIIVIDLENDNEPVGMGQVGR
ncbi:hypothetical protein [Sphingobacterium faecale]|uniref:Uncharacterized protein n=1 Tax=Sphingobacterium faecale TaxID=2803775 RepID=A0ABS1QZ33_9SPHI|nr:hypothetical protein [Sphingobacterium faecale]MBL1407693.1 hypothetical protein [Sphingobacterium faecale]